MDPDDPVAKCEAELRRAMLSGDVSALDRMIDDALIFTTQSGSVVGKKADLDAHRTGQLRLTTLEPIDQRIQRFGSAAVVSVRADVAGVYDSTPFSGTFRYTRVWYERPDGWRVVAGHVSPVIP